MFMFMFMFMFMYIYMYIAPAARLHTRRCALVRGTLSASVVVPCGFDARDAHGPRAQACAVRWFPRAALQDCDDDADGRACV